MLSVEVNCGDAAVLQVLHVERECSGCTAELAGTSCGSTCHRLNLLAS